MEQHALLQVRSSPEPSKARISQTQLHVAAHRSLGFGPRPFKSKASDVHVGSSIGGSRVIGGTRIRCGAAAVSGHRQRTRTYMTATSLICRWYFSTGYRLPSGADEAEDVADHLYQVATALVISHLRVRGRATFWRDLFNSTL